MSKVYDYYLEMAELSLEQGWIEMTTINEQDIETYYRDNQDELDAEWEDYLSYGEWGSGEDQIKITNEMFWEFIEEKMDVEKASLNQRGDQ